MSQSGYCGPTTPLGNFSAKKTLKNHCYKQPIYYTQSYFHILNVCWLTKKTGKGQCLFRIFKINKGFGKKYNIMATLLPYNLQSAAL